jgi:hypothetical protein
MSCKREKQNEKQEEEEYRKKNQDLEPAPQDLKLGICIHFIH